MKHLLRLAKSAGYTLSPLAWLALITACAVGWVGLLWFAALLRAKQDRIDIQSTRIQSLRIFLMENRIDPETGKGWSE